MIPPGKTRVPLISAQALRCQVSGRRCLVATRAARGMHRRTGAHQEPARGCRRRGEERFPGVWTYRTRDVLVPLNSHRVWRGYTSCRTQSRRARSYRHSRRTLRRCLPARKGKRAPRRTHGDVRRRSALQSHHPSRGTFFEKQQTRPTRLSRDQL